jgi:hypothetical protein
MADVVFSFDDKVSLYNAISLASNLSGSHQITVRYATGSPTRINVSSIDTGGNGYLEQAEIDSFISSATPTSGAITINPVSGGKLIHPENLKISEPVYNDNIGNIAIGVAPRIKKSMTIDFLSQGGEQYDINDGSRLELISTGPAINPRPYSIASDLTASAYVNFFSGLKVDDGDSSSQIDVTIKNFYTSPLGINFWKIDLGPDQSAVEYADFGAVIDNHENLTLENYAHDSYWAIGKNSAVTSAAPILNKPGATLTVTGKVVSGQAFQYGQSLLYNQGTANLVNAQLNIYDISKPGVPEFNNAFGGASRATGAITNALGAQLSISSSRVSQESADRGGEYPTDQITRNLGETTVVNRTQIPPADPKSLEHIVLNYGTLTAQDSEIAGIIINEGNANFDKTKVGLSKSISLNGSNLVIRGGSTQLTESTVDNIERSGSGTLNQSNSVVIKGYGSGALSASLASTLDPNRPTLFSDATTPQNGFINPFVYQSYDGSRLNPALLSAVNSILAGSAPGSGGGSSPGGGSTSPGGGGSSIGSGTSSSGTSNNPASNPGLDNDNLDESPANHNGLIIDGNKDGIADATQSNVAGLRRTGDGTSAGDYAALAVGPDYTLNAVTLLPITNNQVQVSLPSGGTITTPIPTGISALLEPLEFYVEGVTPGATIEAELFIPDNFNEQTDAYMRFNYRTKRFEEYVDSNGQKLYKLLDENADGKIDRVVFSLTDGDPDWDGDGTANGVIIDPGSPIDAALNFTGSNKRDKITGNLLANMIRGKGGRDRIDGGLGRDVIRGDKGNDRITGGEHGDLLNGGHGKDRFIYHSAADSSANNPYQQDQISDFQKNDRIDLRHFDADPSQAGTQHFHFIGKRFFTGKTGQLRFGSGLLSADLDGDRIADFAVAVDGNLNSRQLLLGA